MVRDALRRQPRSLIRFTILEDGKGAAHRGPSARPWLKYTLALVGACAVTAGVLTYVLGSRSLKVTRRGKAISKAVSNIVLTNFSSCQMEEDLKVNCGHRGIDQSSCVSRGCCYQPSATPGIPWCFVAKDNMDKKCTVPRQDKINCGFRGIGRRQCEARGCCYANAGAEGVPWCFQKPQANRPKQPLATPQQCAVPGREKVECGFSGITEAQCLDKGCCYERTGAPDQPYCFAPWQFVYGAEAEEVEECGIVEADRIECGFEGISATQCTTRGCCYERTGDDDVPFCFQKSNRIYHAGDKAVAEECAVPDRERFDCGSPKIKPEQCRAKGCCYAPAETSGAPYCFYRSPTEAGLPIRLPNNTRTFGSGVGGVGGASSTEVSPTTMLVSALLAAAGAGICVGACVLVARSSGADAEDAPEDPVPGTHDAPKDPQGHAPEPDEAAEAKAATQDSGAGAFTPEMQTYDGLPMY